MTYEPTLIVANNAPPVFADNLHLAIQKINQNYVDISTALTGILNGLDWQDSVKSKSVSTPPESPTDGDRYIVPTNAGGDWADQDTNIALYLLGSWQFISPESGFCCLVEDEDVDYVFNGSSWVAKGAGTVHNLLSGLNDGDYQHLTAAEYAAFVTNAVETGQDIAGGLFTDNVEVGVSLVYSDSTGKVSATVTYGDTENTACEGNDSRLSDAREPLSHGHDVIDTALERLANTSGTNTGNETTTSVGDLLEGASAKSLPVDADLLGLSDSAASGILKKLSWSNLKAAAKIYFDTIYFLASNVDTDDDLTANSDSRVPSQSAVRSYVAANSAGGNVTGVAGHTLTQYNCVYISASDGRYYKADASAESTGDCVGIVMQSGTILQGNSVSVKIVPGIVTYGTWTAGGAIYLGTSGAITQTEPSSGVFKPLGFAISTTQILFKPDTGYVLD